MSDQLQDAVQRFRDEVGEPRSQFEAEAMQIIDGLSDKLAEAEDKFRWRKPDVSAYPKECVLLKLRSKETRRVFTIYARYICAHSEEADFESDADLWCEYDEEKDCYWLPEGFYENAEFSGGYAAYYVGSDIEVVGWLPIPSTETGDSDE